jgi:hypothetical protein
MRDRNWLCLAVLAAVPGCGVITQPADDRATVVGCAGYMSALELAMETHDAPGFTKAVVDTGNSDLKAREQVLELRAADFNEASRSYRTTMDTAKAVQLEQQGGDLARKHHGAADGVAAGHYLANCAEAYWRAAKQS